MELALADGYRLRPFAPGDEDAVVRHANDPDVARWLRDRFPHPYTRADAEAWVRAASRLEPLTAFAIATEREAVGGIGLDVGSDVHRRTAELGYWLGRTHWNRGVATAAVRALCARAFEELDLVRIHAEIFEGNDASVRVLEKAGFELEGRLRKSAHKHGRDLDQLVYALLRA